MVYLQRWHGWCHKNLLPSRRVLCTPYNHAPCHFMQSHIRKVYACLAVTCHLRFWQNDRGLLRATAVTRGWNGYRNKSQHRKLTLEKKILPRSSRDSNPRPFDHESGALTTELSPPPQLSPLPARGNASSISNLANSCLHRQPCGLKRQTILWLWLGVRSLAAVSGDDGWQEAGIKSGLEASLADGEWTPNAESRKS